MLVICFDLKIRQQRIIQQQYDPYIVRITAQLTAIFQLFINTSIFHIILNVYYKYALPQISTSERVN